MKTAITTPPFRPPPPSQPPYALLLIVGIPLLMTVAWYLLY